MDNYCITINCLIKWGTFVVLCLCNLSLVNGKYYNFRPPQKTLTCYDCAKKGCGTLVQNYPARAGKCETRLGQGKCFIRQDPNQRIYWGCIDDYFWPDVPWRRFNGCFQDWERSWEHNGVRKPIVWCFCDSDNCNLDIARLNSTGLPDTTTTRPTTPMNGGKEGPEQCYNKYNQVGLGYKSCDQICDIIHGRVHCSCYQGYTLYKDGRKCKDVNECEFSNGGCSQSCVNTHGSFYCTYVNECEFSNGGCSQSCVNTHGSVYCTCNQDVNECEFSNGGCSQSCVNTHGSFYCTCNQGYSTGKNGKTCMDVNECQNGNGGCSHTCTNTQGSYQCSCPRGYMLSHDGRTCDDINECKTNQHQCSGACTNTLGSYTCACMPGFTMGQNGRICVDMNECQNGNGGCSHTCTNTQASYQCGCPQGYMLAHDGRTCDDINECKTNQHQCSGACTNTMGSYTCACMPGFIMGQDGRDCVDIDECTAGSHSCLQTCVNTYGSYYCECVPGFTLNLDQKTCLDINECALPGQAGCQQLCTNTEGSYYCDCNPGYNLNTDKLTCSDIDECQTANGNCDQMCNNYIGGYSCGCNPGYQVVVNTTKCVDQNECMMNNGDCSHKCINTPGSYECRCHDETLYALSSDGKTCIAICPSAFLPGYQTHSCYKIFTPTLDNKTIQRDYYEAEQECQRLHKNAHLINIDDAAEKDFIASHLRTQSTLLDGWQGWWTAAKFSDRDGDFVWSTNRKVIDRNDPLWSFKKEPYEDTCLWVMQIPSYDYTWGNYECVTKSGYICEITLPSS